MECLHRSLFLLVLEKHATANSKLSSHEADVLNAKTALGEVEKELQQCVEEKDGCDHSRQQAVSQL